MQNQYNGACIYHASATAWYNVICPTFLWEACRSLSTSPYHSLLGRSPHRLSQDGKFRRVFGQWGSHADMSSLVEKVWVSWWAPWVYKEGDPPPPEKCLWLFCRIMYSPSNLRPLLSLPKELTDEETNVGGPLTRQGGYEQQLHLIPSPNEPSQFPSVVV